MCVCECLPVLLLRYGGCSVFTAIDATAIRISVLDNSKIDKTIESFRIMVDVVVIRVCERDRVKSHNLLLDLNNAIGWHGERLT